MKTTREKLLIDLSQRTQTMLNSAKEYQHKTKAELNWRPNDESWSVLECLEHLNLYGDFYLPMLEEKMLSAPESPQATEFKSGWLGNYSAKSMYPESGEIKKMSTFKSKNPLHSGLEVTTVDRFIRQQEKMLELLKLAQKMDLSKIKTPTTLGKWLKFRLGDTFRFVILHNQRHILQAEQVLKLQARK